MEAARKYQFAEAFDGGKSSETEAALDKARAAWEAEAQAREAAAFEAGKQDALTGLEASINAQMQAVGAHIAALQADHSALTDTISLAAVELAQIAAEKIADVLIERGPGRLVAETVLNALPLVVGEARIVVRVAEPIVDHIKARMDEMALEAGFTGKVILLADERIAPGDCKIEWANGGIERRAEDIKTQLDDTIAASLAEHDGTLARDDVTAPETDTDNSEIPLTEDAP